MKIAPAEHADLQHSPLTFRLYFPSNVLMAIEVPVLTFLFIYIKYAANRRQGLQPLTGLLTIHHTLLNDIVWTLYL